MIVKQYDLAKYAGKRKHGSQMTREEASSIWSRLKKVKEDEWIFTDHTFIRSLEKGIKITKKDLTSAIHNSELIEYKIDKLKFEDTYQERVVLRSKSIVNRCYNIHVVYSLSNNKVITVWMNHIKDRHKTLDWSIYDENLKVFGL